LVPQRPQEPALGASEERHHLPVAADEFEIAGAPAGSPEMRAMRASPWDSPAVENRIIAS
jgi:hypothetical protein